MTKEFELLLTVRDYECDQTGVVNNAVYQNYLEHTRHEYLKSLSIDFAELTKNKIALVIIKSTITYRAPLRSGDAFVVTAKIERLTPSKFQFVQNIYTKTERKLILKGEVVGAALGENGPVPPEDFIKMFPALKVLDEY